MAERASNVKLCQINMQITNSKLMPDRSRLELTTTASGAVAQQGACGKYATVGQRQKRGGADFMGGLGGNRNQLIIEASSSQKNLNTMMPTILKKRVNNKTVVDKQCNNTNDSSAKNQHKHSHHQR